MLGARHDTFRMNDYVPSRGYLQTMTANGFAQAAANAITHYRATQRFFDAEAKAAERQLIGAKKNHEVRTGTPASGAIDGVEIPAAHQARLARKIQALDFIRA
jgi:hypothetical protein